MEVVKVKDEQMLLRFFNHNCGLIKQKRVETLRWLPPALRTIFDLLITHVSEIESMRTDDEELYTYSLKPIISTCIVGILIYLHGTIN